MDNFDMQEAFRILIKEDESSLIPYFNKIYSLAEQIKEEMVKERLNSGTPLSFHSDGRTSFIEFSTKYTLGYNGKLNFEINDFCRFLKKQPKEDIEELVNELNNKGISLYVNAFDAAYNNSVAIDFNFKGEKQLYYSIGEKAISQVIL